MPKQSNNISDISNQDLFQLKKIANKGSSVKLTIGNKKFDLSGIDASILTAGDVCFISLNSVHAIFKGGQPVDESEKSQAIRTLKASTKSKPKAKRGSAPELPEDLKKLLEDFSKTSNARVVFSPTGEYKIQRVRGKRKS